MEKFFANIKKNAKLICRSRKNCSLFAFCLFFLAVIFFILNFSERRSGGNVIAMVDGYRITVEDILAELEMSPDFYKESLARNPEVLLENYINQILVYREASRYQRKYQKKIDAMVTNFRIKTLSQKFVDNEIAGSIEIDDDAVSDYYNRNMDDFVIPEKVRIYEIVLDSREKAEQVLRRLERGESFEALARRESISESRARGGDLGWIDTRKLDEEIVFMVRRINPGDILANIVRTELGYHIIRLGGRTERRMLALSEAAPSIREVLTVKQKKRAVEDLIARKREESRIRIFSSKTELLREGLR